METIKITQQVVEVSRPCPLLARAPATKYKYIALNLQVQIKKTALPQCNTLCTTVMHWRGVLHWTKLSGGCPWKITQFLGRESWKSSRSTQEMEMLKQTFEAVQAQAMYKLKDIFDKRNTETQVGDGQTSFCCQSALGNLENQRCH